MPHPLPIQGHASLFGLADLSGDVVHRGAFARALRLKPSVPMLFQHDPAEPVGVWTTLREDARGLFVAGEILPEGPRGRTVAGLVARGAVTGLSIGFRTRHAAARRPRGRDLFDIDLWEVSIVTFPMLPQARLRLAEPAARAA
ncbi:HK97 family phage prohead protease [Maricaulis sp.]|uniref:HK97 family phage prohead protease n=1 Tax=Maricaulis sp. TaxID=1486257 RepID=UPI00261CD55F|nr:HK97 family phage prohead protease [Maricaulis sp.]